MLILTLDGFAVDLPPDTEVALSYRVSDLATLGSREGGFSETITLPLTNRNLRVLELAHSLDSTTSIPYRRVPFALEQNDMPVLTGQALLEGSTADGYEITLLSTSGALFAAVGDAKLRDLDLSAHDHQLTSAAVQAGQTVTDATVYTYPLVNDGRFTRRYPYLPTATVHYTELAPAVFSRHLIEGIVAQALPGYGLGGSLLEDERLQRHQLLGGKADPMRRAAYLDSNTAVVRSVATQQSSSPNSTTDATTNLVFATVDSDPGGHIGLDSSGYSFYQCLPEVSDYRVELEAEIIYEGTGSAANNEQLAEIVIAENNIFTRRETIYQTSPPQQFQPQTRRIRLNFTFERVGGLGRIQVYLRTKNRIRLVIKPGAKLTITPLPRAYDNSPVHLDAGLPDWTQADLLLLIANQLGAVYQIDEVRRMVRLDSIRDIATHRAAGSFVDWSAKVDRTTRPELRYRLDGLAQRNVFRYKDAPGGYELLENGAYTAAGALLCPADKTLETESEAYTALVPALRSALAFQFTALLPYMPRYEFAEGEHLELWRPNITYPTDYYVLDRGRYWRSRTANSSTQHPQSNLNAWLLAPEESAIYSGGEADYFCGLYEPLPSGIAARVGDSGGDAGFLPSAGITFEGLDFADHLLPTYYPVLAQAFERLLVLDIGIRLTPSDIATLDFTVPIVLNIVHWQGYGPLQGVFMLHLVDQYIPDSMGPVPCQLLCLGGPVITQVTLSERQRVFDYTFAREFN